jgi:hypothetical protein
LIESIFSQFSDFHPSLDKVSGNGFARALWRTGSQYVEPTFQLAAVNGWVVLGK